MVVVVDADGLIGISNEQDTHFLQSTKILQKLIKLKVRLIYPATMLAEATAVLQIRLNKLDTVNQIIESIKSGALYAETIDQATILKAVSFLKESRSKHATIFDGIVAAIAQEHNADAIFSFDKFYKKNGFKLAEEI